MIENFRFDDGFRCRAVLFASMLKLYVRCEIASIMQNNAIKSD